MFKVAYNACYGGFGLSAKAEKLLWEKKTGKEIFAYTHDYENNNYIKITDFDQPGGFGYYYFTPNDYGDVLVEQYPEESTEFDVDRLARHDKDLIAVIEELGDAANGPCSKLRIDEIHVPIYRITEYDGYESVETPDNIGWCVIETNELPEK